MSTTKYNHIIPKDKNKPHSSDNLKYIPVIVPDGHDAAKYLSAFGDGYDRAEKEFDWHSVDECLPPIEEEVIALTNEINGKKLPVVSRICFAHRPNPDGWDGKSLSTGKVKHFQAKTYDAGGWNIPGVKYWMHCPDLEELK